MCDVYREEKMFTKGLNMAKHGVFHYKSET